MARQGNARQDKTRRAKARQDEGRQGRTGIRVRIEEGGRPGKRFLQGKMAHSAGFEPTTPLRRAEELMGSELCKTVIFSFNRYKTVI